MRAAVLERDDYQCVRCGVSNDRHKAVYGRGLDVRRRVRGSAHTVEGCETVCRACNVHLSQVPARGRRDGWGSHPDSGAGRINALLVAARGPMTTAAIEAGGYRAKSAGYLSRLARDGFIRCTPGGYKVTRAGRLLWRHAAKRSDGSGVPVARGTKK